MADCIRRNSVTQKIFDLEDVYDQVDVGVPAQKMTRLGISDVMVRWVLAMLDSRRCQMQFGSWTSDFFEVSSGLTQGSPLSPVLFNIYTADLVEALEHPGVVSKLYVDDAIVMSTAGTPTEAVQGLQHASNMFHSLTQNNNMASQADKAGWTLVTIAHVRTEAYQLTYGGEVVPPQETLVCLGVAIDRRMTTKAHAARIYEKSVKSLGVLRYAAHQQVKQKSLLQLMKVTVSSPLEYGLHICVNAAATAIDKIQRVQNEAMRIVASAAKPTACDALRFWLGVTSVRGRQAILAVQAFLSAMTTPSHPLHDDIRAREDECVTQRLKTVQSWVVRACEMVEEVCVCENIREREWVSKDRENR